MRQAWPGFKPGMKPPRQVQLSGSYPPLHGKTESKSAGTRLYSLRSNYVDKFGILKDEELLLPPPKKAERPKEVGKRRPKPCVLSQSPRRVVKFSSEQRMLNQAMNACTHPEALLRMVDEHADTPDFTTVNAATAFYKLAKLSEALSEVQRARVRNDSRTKQLAGIVEARWQEWGGFATSNIIWAHAYLGHGSPSLPEKAEARFLVTLPNMMHQEVSGVLPGLLSTGQLSKKTFENIRAPLLRWLETRHKPIPARCISSVLRVYAKAEHCTSEADQVIYEALGVETRRLLQQNSLILPRELANMVWGFAKLEVKDSKLFDFLAQAIFDVLDPRELRSKGMTLASQDLAQMSWGLGKGFSNNVTIPQRYARPDSWLHDYVNQYPIREAVFERILTHAMSMAKEFKDTGVAGLLCGCAHILYYDEGILAGMAEVIIEKSQGYSEQAVCIAMWSFATLHFDAPAAFEALAERMLDFVRDTPENLTTQGVVMFLTSCALVDLRELPTCMLACKELAILLEDKLLESGSQTLANTAYALTVLELLEPRFFRKLCLAMSKTTGPFQQELPQIYQADLALSLRTPGVVPSTNESATDISDFLQECFDLGELKMAARAHWRNLIKHSFRNISGLQWTVAQVLSSLGAHFRLEYDDHDYPVDIALEGQKIAIEVDGPHHFTSNTLRPLGYHVLKTRLLQQQGWKIISVPFFEWGKLQKEQERQAYLSKLLYDAGWNGPDATSATEVTPKPQAPVPKEAEPSPLRLPETDSATCDSQVSGIGGLPTSLGHQRQQQDTAEGIASSGDEFIEGVRLEKEPRGLNEAPVGRNSLQESSEDLDSPAREHATPSEPGSQSAHASGSVRRHAMVKVLTRGGQRKVSRSDLVSKLSNAEKQRRAVSEPDR